MRRTAILTAIGFSLCVAPAALAQTPPDPLANLAADVSAVLDGGERPQILLNETDHDVNSTRTIGVGDEYRDGWKITAITSASVTLNKGRDTRTIALAGRRQTQAAAAPAPGAANVAASNSLVGGSGPGRGGPRSLELQTAIGAGNVKQVLQMGGSAADAAAALQAQGRAPSIVARWRHTRLTTRTPTVARMSAKRSAISPVAAASVIAGSGSLTRPPVWIPVR